MCGRRRDNALALRDQFVGEAKHCRRFAAATDKRDNFFRMDAEGLRKPHFRFMIYDLQI
jgi:hypothetical protein